MSNHDPIVTKWRGALLAMLAGLVFYVIVGLAACSAARADDSLILGNKRELHITRPISIVLVDNLPEGIEGCENTNYACAPNAFGKGRCIIFIKPSFLSCLFHEQQHCMGVMHSDLPSDERCGELNLRRS